jgi:threonine/homoserine/homoserine lactone efflux protein
MRTDLTVILTTLAVYLAVTISPGPNFALVSRLAISGSRRAALSASAGIATASMIYAGLSMTVLAILLREISRLASGVQIIGGCNLTIEAIWYGLVAMLLSTPGARAIYRRLGRWIERLIGTLLVGSGLRLIYDRS